MPSFLDKRPPPAPPRDRVVLDAQQERAVSRACKFIEDPNARGAFYIAGPAGTGKTTIAKEIANRLGNVAFAAYTGKAASVLAAKGCVGATTIHSLYYAPTSKGDEATKLTDLKVALERAAARVAETPKTDPAHAALEKEWADLHVKVTVAERNAGRPMFKLRPSAALEDARAVLLDEVSMVGKRMAEDILSVTPKILVTGDPFQLPPVGEAGYFTGRKPDVMLDHVHRQGLDSPILRLATDIREGRQIHDVYGEDCRVLPLNGSGHDLQAMCLAASQMIVGKNVTRWAANQKHRRLRGRTSPLPVPGDRVMCLRNDHEAGLLNGTIWEVLDADAPTQEGRLIGLEIQSIDDGRKTFVEAATALFLDEQARPAMFDRDGPASFTYAYAITCHKSQGSEFDTGYILDESRVFREDAEKWLYTAVTRFRDRIVLVRP